MADKTTFVKISNREIYESVQALHGKVDKITQRQGIHEKLLNIGGAILVILTGILTQHVSK
jgi:hypothetical protein